MLKRLRKGCRGEEGYSLPELMIAIIILAAIVFATFQVMNANIQGGRVFTARADLAEQLRSTLDTMVTQLRTAREFTAANASEVTFQGYVTGGGTMETVRFYLSGTDFYCSSAALYGSDQILTTDVTSVYFTYYDGAGSKLNDPDNSDPEVDPADVPSGSLASVTMVEIALTIDYDIGDIGIGDTAVTTVRIRK